MAYVLTCACVARMALPHRLPSHLRAFPLHYDDLAPGITSMASD